MVDSARIGEKEEWFLSEYDDSSWHTIEVPHTWNVMDEFYEYIGEAWYRHEFVPDRDIGSAKLFLCFKAVYYKAEVWLNGEYLGEHEGGYTPFEFDVSDLVRAHMKNTIAVKVDNYRRFDRIPDDFFDWWPYGGIVRDVSLEASNRIFIEDQRIVAIPHIIHWDEADTAEVVTSVSIVNTSNIDFEGRLLTHIRDEGTESSALEDVSEKPIHIPNGERVEVDLNAVIQSPKLWHFDHPDLYVWETTLVDKAGRSYDVQNDVFGIRLIELKDGRFLLNGEPVRLVGMTRHVDSPEYGLAEPVSFMTADYDDMKRLNMVFSRPVHYPQDASVLDYCDRNGILLAPEIPAWQIEASHLGNQDTLATARQQLTEMILSSFNHPSIWAWSVANEIDSDTSQGRDFIRELVELAHDLDPTRPVGFASYRLYSDQDKDATTLTDFVFMNEYAGSWHGSKESLTESLDRIHELWPDKVVIISEFGLEGEWTASPWMGNTSHLNNDSYYYMEPGTSPYSEEVYALRSQVIIDQMEVFRSKPFVAGAIFWTYQDYRSDMDFKMGLLDQDRNRSPVWGVLKDQYSPILSVSINVSDEDQRLTVELQTRGPVTSDMPAYTLRDYSLLWQTFSSADDALISEGSIPLPALAPAETWTGALDTGILESDTRILLQIIRPTGFSVFEQSYNTNGDLIP
ncbi:MAG: hypothetical protein GTO18_06800 [Anaerolineales bacterium]|nr:hypothetical protein [Anaerolineales bacterium]